MKMISKRFLMNMLCLQIKSANLSDFDEIFEQDIDLIKHLPIIKKLCCVTKRWIHSRVLHSRQDNKYLCELVRHRQTLVKMRTKSHSITFMKRVRPPGIHSFIHKHIEKLKETKDLRIEGFHSMIDHIIIP